MTKISTKKVESASNVLSNYKVAVGEDKLNGQKAYNMRVFPRIAYRRTQVDDFEQRLNSNAARDFASIDQTQKDTLDILTKKNISNSKKAFSLLSYGGQVINELYEIHKELNTPKKAIVDGRISKTSIEFQLNLTNTKLPPLKRADDQSPTLNVVKQYSSDTEMAASPEDLKKPLYDIIPDRTSNFLLDGALQFESDSSLEQTKEISQTFFDLSYPIIENQLISDKYPLESLLDYENAKKTVEDRRPIPEKKMTLRQMYGKIIDPSSPSGGDSQARNDMEQEALIAMKSVSTDLQNWAKDVLDNSINLDPKVLQAVNEMDEKYGVERPKKEMQLGTDVDTTGFNILLNACKPTILEAKPPMKLSMPVEMERKIVIEPSIGTEEYNLMKKGEAGKRRPKMRNPWYLKPSQWSEMYSSETKQSLDSKNKQSRILGVVQQKLDDIARKREEEETLFAREIKGKLA